MQKTDWLRLLPVFFWALIGVVALFGFLMPKRLVSLLTLHAIELPRWGSIVVRGVALFFILGVIRVFLSGMAFQSIP